MMQLSAGRARPPSQILSSQARLLDQHFADGASVHAAAHDLFELVAVIGNAAARAAKREGWADDERQADPLHFLEACRHIAHDGACWRGEADFVHRVAEQLAVFGFGDRVLARADQLNAVFLQRAESASASAVFSAVCPPIVGSSASGFSLAMIFSTISGVIGSI